MTQQVVEYQQPQELAPNEVITRAETQATALMKLVNDRHLYLQVGNKRHLYVEAWETIGAFNRSKAVPETVDPIFQDSAIIGYKARVLLMKDGVIDGGGIGMCFLTEWVCLDRDGKIKDNGHSACQSMAQTRAISRAYRANYAWVAVLAGYDPTPAEEIVSETPQGPAARRGPDRPAPANRRAAPPQEESADLPTAQPAAKSFGPRVIEVAKSMGWDDEQLRSWLQAQGYIQNGKLIHGDVALTEIQRLARLPGSQEALPEGAEVEALP